MSSLPYAIVTGASRGIGRAIALRLAQEGYAVWALARSVDALADLEADAAATTGKVLPLRFDAERPEDVVAAAQSVLNAGVPQVLVNNAGVAPSAPLAKTDLETFVRTLTVNTTAPFLLCRELMPRMAANGGGRVINIASTAGLKGFKYTSAYSASKHALVGLTRSLAVEFAAKGVTVNAICPGWTDTDMLAASAKNIAKATGRTEGEARDALAQLNPMGRLVSPSQVAELCVFLASPAAAIITGACYTMDGGELA